MRSPAALVRTTLASSVSNTGALSPIGEAVTRLPPSVARLRICREANTRSILAKEGYSPATASSIFVSVAAAPMRQAASVFTICVSSGTASVEMSSGKVLELLVQLHADLGRAGH